MKARHEWIVCHDGTAGKLAYAMECRRCGDIQRVALPIALDCWVALAWAFERMHARCREDSPKNPAED